MQLSTRKERQKEGREDTIAARRVVWVSDEERGGERRLRHFAPAGTEREDTASKLQAGLFYLRYFEKLST